MRFSNHTRSRRIAVRVVAARERTIRRYVRPRELRAL